MSFENDKLYSRLRISNKIFYNSHIDAKLKEKMTIIYYIAFLGFGFGSAFLLDKLLRAVKLI